MITKTRSPANEKLCCRCHASQPVYQQGNYPSGYYSRSSTSFQTPSRARTAMPSSQLPFTPRLRGPPIVTQHHYADAPAHTGSSFNPLANTLHDNHHARIANLYTSPRCNLSPMRALHREPPIQQQFFGHQPLPPVTRDTHPVPQASSQTRARATTKRKASTMTGAPVPKPRAKRPRVPASLDTGPIAAGCGVGPPFPNDDPVSATPLSPVLPAAGPSVPIPSEPSSTSLPNVSYPSLSQNRRLTTKQHSATDCWYFVRAAVSDV